MSPGVARCGPNGFNIFGRNLLSAECVEYITVASTLSTDFKQQVGEVIFTGDVAELPAGPLSVAFGGQGRWFKYELDPGPSAGPISGFNAQTPSKGENSFEDLFFEALIPVVKDKPGFQSLELNLGYRSSTAKFEDKIQDLESPSDTSDAYFISANWAVNDTWRFRGGYQRAVRAPNFGELFDGGGSVRTGSALQPSTSPVPAPARSSRPGTASGKASPLSFAFGSRARTVRLSRCSTPVRDPAGEGPGGRAA